MNKNKLIKFVQSADISEDFKKELMSLIEKENGSDSEIVKKVQAKLNQHTDEIIDNISDIRMQNAVNQLDQDLDDIETDINELQVEVNEKADEIDLQEVRSKVAK